MRSVSEQLCLLQNLRSSIHWYCTIVAFSAAGKNPGRVVINKAISFFSESVFQEH